MDLLRNAGEHALPAGLWLIDGALGLTSYGNFQMLPSPMAEPMLASTKPRAAGPVFAVFLDLHG